MGSFHPEQEEPVFNSGVIHALITAIQLIANLLTQKRTPSAAGFSCLSLKQQSVDSSIMNQTCLFSD